jgi:pimeloyl-ACP methyl ester carboxylesterase
MKRTETPITAISVSTVLTGEIMLAYSVMGKGEPLLLIMGLGGSMHEWDRIFLNRMAEKFRVIIFDNRGAGDSGGAHLPLTITDMSMDCYHLLRSLGIIHANLFGYSMGTMIALDLAEKFKEMVGRIILYAPVINGASVLTRLEPFIDPTLPELIRIEALFPAFFIAEHPEISTVFPPPVHPVNIPLIWRQIKAMEHYSLSDKTLGSLGKPALILVGSEDVITPPESSQDIANNIPGAGIMVIPGGGHGMMYQVPEILASLTVRFLERDLT